MRAAPSEQVAERYRCALAAARSDDREAAWKALEEAHVLSQPWVGMHIRAHGAMLALAWRCRDRRELLGQIVRLGVAGPGSFTGRYPKGNTGRARVSMWAPMPIADDLVDLVG